MKRDLVWYPATNSPKNHLYDMQSKKALCGSIAKPKDDPRGWGNNYWQFVDCPRCKSRANELEAEE